MRRNLWELYNGGVGCGPEKVIDPSKRSKLSSLERVALWTGVQGWGTNWADVQRSAPVLHKYTPESLRQFAVNLGVIVATPFSTPVSKSGNDDVGEGDYDPPVDYDPPGAPGASAAAADLRETESADGDHLQAADDDADSVGTGFLRRMRQDESAAEVHEALLEEMFTCYAAPPCVRCSDCEYLLRPEDISCRCLDCTVYRCRGCSQKHRLGKSGLFHVTEEFNPDGQVCVLRARAGEHDCIVPGFDFCQGCGGHLLSRDPTVVKLISDRFGVESVRLPARQECTNAACGRVHEQREMLRRLYSFEPQTAIRPETFYSNTLLNAMMQRQYTSAELEATSLNQSFQARKLADGVDDRGLSLAYHSYFERAMAFKEKAYVTTICKDLDKVHFPSCKCCTGWVKNGAVHELRWYRNLILVVDGNF